MTLARGPRRVTFTAAALREATARLGALWPRMFDDAQARVAAMEAMAVAVATALEEARSPEKEHNMAAEPAALAAIRVEFIPHGDQRYPTAGDWFTRGDELIIRVSRTRDERHQQLVAVHELVETLLCRHDGVTAAEVDAFDMGPGAVLDDPGTSADAPYHAQHMVATAVERVMASALRVEWADYETALDSLAVSPEVGA